MTHLDLDKIVKVDGTLRKTWTQPKPPAGAWFDVDGVRWAVNSHYAVTESVPAIEAPEEAGYAHPGWLIVVETEDERTTLQRQINKLWGNRKGKSLRAEPAGVLTKTQAAYLIEKEASQAIEQRRPHRGVFNAVFRPVLASGAAVLASDHAELGPAFVVDDEDRLIGLVMPMRDPSVGLRVCNAQGEVWTVVETEADRKLREKVERMTRKKKARA